MRVIIAVVAVLAALAVADASKLTTMRAMRGKLEVVNALTVTKSCVGTCQEDTAPCATYYVSGRCDGGRTRRCCLSEQGAAEEKANNERKNPPQDRKEDNKGPDSSANGQGWGALTFKALQQAYPDAAPEDVKRRIGGGVNAGYITNTCVIRVSKAIQDAGGEAHFIPRNWPLPAAAKPSKPGQCMYTEQGADGRRYALRVKEFQYYMRHKYGAPTLSKDNGSNGATQGMQVPPSFAGKKGIIRFEVNGWSDATGHFDVWDGDALKCSGHCYWDKAWKVELWQVTK